MSPIINKKIAPKVIKEYFKNLFNCRLYKVAEFNALIRLQLLFCFNSIRRMANLGLRNDRAPCKDVQS